MNILFKLFGGSYDDLWKAVIRPNRDNYTIDELGPFKFELKGKCYKRTDFELINKRSQKLMCSFWEPFDEEREKPRLPCVIYLHGNSSSRVEAYPEVRYLLQNNITVFAFDFCGCGKSEGEYISLGYFEKKDVHCVVEYLLKSKKVSKIGLWGRSMGAVTAIMYANEHPALIDAMVLDSGFYSLKQLINELIDSKIKLPNFIYEKVLNMVKETIKEKAHFDLDIIEPYIYAKNCIVPAFFCHGSDDKFVLSQHCLELFNEYKSKDKYCEIVKGGHNTARPKDLRLKFCEFLLKFLKDDELQSSGTINNSNTYERIIVNNNIIDKNDKNINIYKNINSNSNFNPNKIKTKIKGKEDENIITNILKKNSFNEFSNRGSTDETNVINNNYFNINPSQNMRAYSQSKYSKNDLKVVNIKNAINNKKNNNDLHLRSVEVNSKKIEENISISSSSSIIEEECPVYKKKKVKDFSEPIKIKTISVSQHFFSNKNNNSKIKLNNPTFINKNISVTNLNTNKKKSYNYNITNSFLHNVIANINSRNNRHINKSIKSFNDKFYGSNSSSKIIQSNYFTTNNIYFNRTRDIKISPMKSEHLMNFSYSSKKPIDKFNGKDKIKEKNVNVNKTKKNMVLKNNVTKKKDIKFLNYQNNNNNKINSKRSVHSTENTYLDENEEIIGRNAPH